MGLGVRAMKFGKAIKLAKPDLFELSEARKDLLCKRILNSSTETLIYFSDQIHSELQDRDMRDFGDEKERIAELEERIAGLERDKDGLTETLAGIESGETEIIYY